MSKLNPDCPKCKNNKLVSEWMVKLNNNIWLCKHCTLTFDPDDSEEHKNSSKYQSLDCPKCNAALNFTEGRTYRHAVCSDSKCNYSMTFRDGKVENQEWTGQKSKGKTEEDSN